MHDPFDRKFGLGSVALVMGKLNNSLKIMTNIKEFLNNFLKNQNYFINLPFLWVGLVYRYGIKNNLKVDFGRIDKKDGELPIGLELDMEILQWADKNNLDLLHDIFMIAALEALLQVCDKYKLPKDVILTERQKYGDIPNTIAECETYQRP